jgi:hypothetical protein
LQHGVQPTFGGNIEVRYQNGEVSSARNDLGRGLVRDGIAFAVNPKKLVEPAPAGAPGAYNPVSVTAAKSPIFHIYRRIPRNRSSKSWLTVPANRTSSYYYSLARRTFNQLSWEIPAKFASFSQCRGWGRFRPARMSEA